MTEKPLPTAEDRYLVPLTTQLELFKELRSEYGVTYLSDVLTVKQVIDFVQPKLHEWEQSFEIYHNATLRGTRLYRELNPDYPVNRHPATGKMIEALCDKIEQLKTEISK